MVSKTVYANVYNCDVGVSQSCACTIAIVYRMLFASVFTWGKQTMARFRVRWSISCVPTMGYERYWDLSPSVRSVRLSLSATGFKSNEGRPRHYSRDPLLQTHLKVTGFEFRINAMLLAAKRRRTSTNGLANHS